MPAKRSAPEPRLCAASDCSVVFTPPRSDAKYHTQTCRQRAARARKAAEAGAREEAKTGTEAEHPLVRAVRKELEQTGEGGALDTVAGQLALQFARRMVDPKEAGLSAMSKELRLLLAEAKGERAPADLGAAGAGAGEPAAPDDEVEKARRRREEIAARAAAGEAGAAEPVAGAEE